MKGEKLTSVILEEIGISVKFKSKQNWGQCEVLREDINTGRRQATWCILRLMSKSYRLHHLTYIEKQCEKRLEYIAHHGMWIVSCNFKTLLVIVHNCQRLLIREFWWQPLRYKINSQVAMCLLKELEEKDEKLKI